MSLESVLVVGLGNIADRHRSNLKRLWPTVKIYAISASGRAVEFSEVDNCDYGIGCLAELDKVKLDFAIVASPATKRLQFVEFISRLSVPILIEKPLAVTLHEAELIADLVASWRGRVSVAYCLRFLSSAEKLKQYLLDDTWGKVYSIRSEVGQFLPDWRVAKDYKTSVSANRSLGGGAVAELSHEIDYLQWLFGPLQLKYANVKNTGLLDIDVEDVAELMLITQSGTSISLHMDFLQRQPFRQCVILTERGRVVWNIITNSIILVNENGKFILFNGSLEAGNNMYLKMLKAFADVSKEEQLSTVEEGVAVASLIEQSLKRF